MKIRLAIPTSMALAALLSFAACGDDPLVGGEVDTSEEADTGVLDLDSVLPIDTHFEPLDTTSPVEDTAAPEVVEPSCDDDVKPFYCPCLNNVQCESSYCVPVDEDDVSARCSRVCAESCPMGWDCRGIAGPDPVFICQPPIDTLCRSCTTDSGCGGVGDRCVDFFDGKYCGKNCQGDPGACPATYGCEEITDSAGQILAYQCVPLSGSCNCEPGLDYDNDPAHCGRCNRACHFPGGVPGCEAGECFLADCQAGFVNLDGHELTGCEYECTKVSDEDWPDANCVGSSCDQDCDGLDGTWTRGVFVSASAGSSGGTGAPDDPVNTITRAIQIAQPGGRDHVYIAAGVYNEQVTMKDGVSIFGGYSNDGQWRRNLAIHETQITSSSGVASIRVIIADGISTHRTVIDGVTVVGGTNANPGGSSYAIWIRNSTDKLELIRVAAIGGNGGNGSSGTNGNPGNPGTTPASGTSASSYDCQCNDYDSYAGWGGAGAPAASCASGPSTAGGRGAHAVENDSCSTSGYTGQPAPTGAPGGAPEQKGSNGDHGASGTNGAGGLAGGTVSGAGFWLGQDGANGTHGANGLGGGGGGSGLTRRGNHAACVFINTYRYGGGGGGGGGGGCGGRLATSGRAGGGSFGVFLVDSNPALIDSAFGHKNGGNGGNGGTGGDGGSGTAGAGAGNGSCYGGLCGTAGGPGGNGGNGGRGGHGGGGAGGVAYGLYLAGSSAPSCSGLSFNPPGAGGTGGLGGIGGIASGANAGNRGADGLFGARNKTSLGCP